MSASQAAWGRRATPAGLCCRSTVYLSGEQGQSFNKKSIFSAPLRNLKIIQVIFRQHLEPQTEGSGVPAPTSLVPWPFCSLPRQEKPPEQTVLLLQNRGFGVSKSPSQGRLAAWRACTGQGKALSTTDGAGDLLVAWDTSTRPSCCPSSSPSSPSILSSRHGGVGREPFQASYTHPFSFSSPGRRPAPSYSPKPSVSFDPAWGCHHAAGGAACC